MATRKNSGIAFKVKKGISIGEPDAESDQLFLAECFTDTGDYGALKDSQNPQRIIVGRTGAGKSALILQLKNTEDNVIEISPENLSLNFISNSDIINLLEKAGVKLDIFYTLLWKHVFAVELLRSKFHLSTEEKTKNWLDHFIQGLRKRDQNKERALAYIRDWGDKFWQETEYRIKEVTQKLENDIKAQLGADINGLKLGVSGGKKISDETTAEVIHRAQRVINSIQIKALSDVLDLLAEEIFDDPQQTYYIVIDKLDENWVDSNLRYRLIRALIETVKSFRVIPAVKIIIALRLDLIQTVFRETRDPGFQEEKYQALMLNLKWDKNSLEKLLDKRIARLVREQYTNQSMGLRALFPKSINNSDFIDYFFSMTFYRPRDAIAFVNECLRKAEGRDGITVQCVRDSENEYSAARMDALYFEWIVHYPRLSEYISLLERMPVKFKLSSFTKDKVDEFALKVFFDGEHDQDPVIKAGYSYLNGGTSHHSFVIELVKAFFTVGIIGIKPDGFTGDLWQSNGARCPSDGQIKPTSSISIHPIAWSRLGIRFD